MIENFDHTRTHFNVKRPLKVDGEDSSTNSDKEERKVSGGNDRRSTSGLQKMVQNRDGQAVPAGVCFDFYLKGFCKKGDMCKYRHERAGNAAERPVYNKNGAGPTMQINKKRKKLNTICSNVHITSFSNVSRASNRKQKTQKQKSKNKKESGKL